MKTSEMQIGDIVSCNGQQMAVVELGIKSTFVAERAGEEEVSKLQYRDAEDLEPVTLTENHLLANGYRKAVEPYFGGCEIFVRDYDGGSVSVRFILKDGFWNMRVMSHRDTLIKRVNHVHQWQQSMRLFGVREQVVL